MQGYLSDSVALEWITGLSARARYVSLHFDVPNWIDTGASELVDAGYSRVAVAWTVSSNRTIGNSAILRFNVALDSNIVALGFHEDLTGSVMLAYATTTNGIPLVVPATGQLSLGIGEVVLGFT
jgi:hypothetical protein